MPSLPEILKNIIRLMTIEQTNLQKTSASVLELLTAEGLSKIFNWDDFLYFEKETAHKVNQPEAIAELFHYWYSHEENDFADYEF